MYAPVTYTTGSTRARGRRRRARAALAADHMIHCIRVSVRYRTSDGVRPYARYTYRQVRRYRLRIRRWRVRRGDSDRAQWVVAPAAMALRAAAGTALDLHGHIYMLSMYTLVLLGNQPAPITARDNGLGRLPPLVRSILRLDEWID